MRLLYTLLLCAGLFLPQVITQVHAAAVPDTLYGFDPILYNGRHYTYTIPRNAEGNPYLYPEFTTGYVMIREKVYAGIYLNLDLIHQALIMKYVNHEGATVLLEIPDSWLSRIRIGNDDFIPVVREGGVHGYDQVIGDGNVKIIYSLRKDLSLDNRYGSPQYIFSKVIRTQYVEIQGTRFAYRNNRSFVRLFKDSVQQNISSYLKNNKIKVGKASESVMRSLADFCQKQQ